MEERAYMGGGKCAMCRARYCRDCDYYMPRSMGTDAEPERMLPWCWRGMREVEPFGHCDGWSLSQFLAEAAGDYR